MGFFWVICFAPWSLRRTFGSGEGDATPIWETVALSLYIILVKILLD